MPLWKRRSRRWPSAASAIAARVAKTGRIVYAGAGSSGTIAALDGIELLGTFGWPEERVAFVLASGDRLAPITGGEEDDEATGRAAIAALGLTPNDAVIAVAASGTTPFTLAVVAAADSVGRAHHRHRQQRRRAAPRGGRRARPPRLRVRK